MFDCGTAKDARLWRSRPQWKIGFQKGSVNLDKVRRHEVRANGSGMRDLPKVRHNLPVSLIADVCYIAAKSLFGAPFWFKSAIP